MVADQVVLNMLQVNNWNRPVYLSGWVGSWALGWIHPYVRNDGYVQKVMPIKSPPLDAAVLRRNLIEQSVIRGYNDISIPMSDVTRQMGMNAVIALANLARLEEQRENVEGCRQVKDFLIENLNPDRLGLPDQFRTAIEQLCETVESD
jgi:hypothetical protein